MKKYLDIIKNNILLILSIGLVLFIVLFFNQCKRTTQLKEEIKNQKILTEQNIKAINDSVTFYKNKYGELVFVKPILKMDIKDIKKLFPELYKKIVSESGVNTIIIHDVKYIDTGSVKNIIKKISKEEYSTLFNYISSDSSMTINGESFFLIKIKNNSLDSTKFDVDVLNGITKFSNIGLNLNITTGIKKDNDGINRIFVSTDNEHVKITKIEGAEIGDFITPIKKKKFGLGIGIGGSAVFGKNNTFYYGPSIQIGLSYNFLNF